MRDSILLWTVQIMQSKTFELQILKVQLLLSASKVCVIGLEIKI